MVMGRESSIDTLNDEDRAWLDQQLNHRGFCGYAEVAELLQQRGYSVSKSSVHRYGQKLERKLAAIKASTEAAVMIADAAPDDADMRSGAVLSMVQTGLFNALVDLQEATENGQLSPVEQVELLAKSGKGIASIMQASVSQKKWQAEVRARAEKAAQAVEKIAKKGGLSAQTVTEIKAQILGIAS